MEFEITKKPEANGRRNVRFSLLRDALLALKDGEAIRVPRESFGGVAAESVLTMKRECGRAVHQKKMADGMYLWLAETKSDING
jgi:hypothetical protein